MYVTVTLTTNNFGTSQVTKYDNQSSHLARVYFDVMAQTPLLRFAVDLLENRPHNKLCSVQHLDSWIFGHVDSILWICRRHA